MPARSPVRATPRRWWLASREPAPIDAWRAIAALGLAAYATAGFGPAAPLFEGADLYDATSLRATLWSRASFLSGASPAAVRAAIAAMVLLALGAAFGPACRACATALAVLGAAAAWALLPVGRADDVVFCATSAALVVLPGGRPARWIARRSRSGPPAEVEGRAADAILLGTLLVYVTGGVSALSGVDGVLGDRITLAFRIVAVAFVAPSTVLLTLALAAQVGIHAWLAYKGHAPLANLVLASTALLFWGAPAEQPTSHAATTRLAGRAWDAAGVTAFAAVALPILAWRPIPGARWVGMRAARILADAGLLAFQAAPSAPWMGADGEVRLSIRAEPDGREERYLYPHTPRTGELSALLAAGPSPMRTAIAASAAHRYCETRAGGMSTVLGPRAYGQLPLLRFRCTADGALADVSIPEAE